jgi:hypothetical protein
VYRLQMRAAVSRFVQYANMNLLQSLGKGAWIGGATGGAIAVTANVVNVAFDSDAELTFETLRRRDELGSMFVWGTYIGLAAGATWPISAPLCAITAVVQLTVLEPQRNANMQNGLGHITDAEVEAQQKEEEKEPPRGR